MKIIISQHQKLKPKRLFLLKQLFRYTHSTYDNWLLIRKRKKILKYHEALRYNGLLITKYENYNLDQILKTMNSFRMFFTLPAFKMSNYLGRKNYQRKNERKKEKEKGRNSWWVDRKERNINLRCIAIKKEKDSFMIFLGPIFLESKKKEKTISCLLWKAFF